MKRFWKEALALIIILAASIIAFPTLWDSEKNIQVPLEQISKIPAAQIPTSHAVLHMIDDGLKPYFYALGLIFVVVAVAFILVDRQERLTTKADPVQEQYEEQSL